MMNFTFVISVAALLFVALLLTFVLLKMLELFKTGKASAPKTSGPESPLPYKAKRFIFSPAEYSFYKMLLDHCPPELYIAPKMRIADFIYVDKVACRMAGEKDFTWFNKISSKHVDFVVCDKKRFTVVGLIELDDSSHNSPKVRARDKFVDKVYKQCGIPIVHQRCKKAYSAETITSIFEALTSGPREENRQGHARAN